MKIKALALAAIVAIGAIASSTDSFAGGRGHGGWHGGGGHGWHGGGGRGWGGRGYYRGGRGWRGNGVGLGIAAGVLGGVAAGLAGGYYGGYYGVPPPLGYSYWQPQPSYYYPPYCLGACRW